MTREHKMKELSFSDIVSEDPVDLVSVTQWTFILPTNELLSYQQINSAIDSSDAEDDAATEGSETIGDKHEEEVDKASLKTRKQKKNDSICF